MLSCVCVVGQSLPLLMPCQHPYWVPAQIPVASLLNQPPTNTAGTMARRWTPATQWETQIGLQAAGLCLTQPCDQLGSDPAARPLLLPVSQCSRKSQRPAATRRCQLMGPWICSKPGAEGTASLWLVPFSDSDPGPPPARSRVVTLWPPASQGDLLQALTECPLL